MTDRTEDVVVGGGRTAVLAVDRSTTPGDVTAAQTSPRVAATPLGHAGGRLRMGRA